MAGVVSPSMPVWQVTDDAGPARRHAFATLNEGLGTVLRFGAYGPEVIDRLRWMSDVLGPVLDAAIQASEPIDVTTLIGQALAMGDEGHNRSVAASALLARRLAPAIAPLDGAVEVLTVPGRQRPLRAQPLDGRGQAVHGRRRRTCRIRRWSR